MSDEGAVLKALIVSDVICPWCYLGIKRFERAVQEISPPLQVALRQLCLYAVTHPRVCPHCRATDWGGDSGGGGGAGGDKLAALHAEPPAGPRGKGPDEEEGIRSQDWQCV